MRSFVFALALALLLVPAAGHARCRMSPGDQLVLVGTRAESGVVLFERRAAYAEGTLLTGQTPDRLAIRRDACTSHCDAQAPLETIAPNLYALRLPRGVQPGRWRVRTQGAGGASFEVGASHARAPITARPVVTGQTPRQAGTRFFVPEIVLTAPAPADAVGVLARWQGSSFFMGAEDDRTHFVLSPGRCRAALPGFTMPAAGEPIELAFVDAQGRLSPTSTIAFSDPSQ
ncbi:MAG: hypothetical protein K1X94_14375 [Sandaracinaceae bacterium]|jgi:hypothetical protein|nr:hypothetical protein [Sandaracinaceae bacterium]